MNATAVIFNIQRFSLHDGPGIRSTVFLKGCPLRCVWCHNPESMSAVLEPMVMADRCVVCGACVDACAEGLAGPLQGADGRGHPGARCTACGECVGECPTEARRLVGESLDVDTLLEDLRRDAAYHESSRGGVTFSGGEPLAAVHAPFVLACLERLKAEGVHTAIDTCGQVRKEDLLAAARLADLVLYDLKIMDPARHEAATGVGNERILQNLRALLETEAAVEVRLPLIPGYTDDAANLEALADFLLAGPRQPRVRLLPYHATGRDKYPRLGRIYSLETMPQQETPTECAALLRRRGLEVEI